MKSFALTEIATALAFPGNRAVADSKEIPGVYVPILAATLGALIGSGGENVHPAFTVSGERKDVLYIGKYQGRESAGRVYSLPGEDPYTGVGLDAFEESCRLKGPGHHCVTAAEWAFLALWSRKSGTMPRGNNQWGEDVGESGIAAVPTSYETGESHKGEPARTATGTGPVAWSHDGTLSGVWDLNGNVWEWTVGVRLVRGELQVIPYNNAADRNVHTGDKSFLWRAVNASAAGYDTLFIEPDGEGTTAGSVKLNWTGDHWVWDTAVVGTEDTERSAAFGTTELGGGLSEFCKTYLRAMALAPEEGAGADSYGGDVFRANNGAGEVCAARGGCWKDGTAAGVFSLDLSRPRMAAAEYIGVRPAFYE